MAYSIDEQEKLNLIEIMIEELEEKVNKLRLQAAKNQQEYGAAYQAAQNFYNNLSDYLIKYKEKKIEGIVFISLSEIQVQQVMPILSNQKFGEWSKFFSKIIQLFNGFISALGLGTRNFENEWVHFNQKVSTLLSKLQENKPIQSDELVMLYPDNETVILACYAINSKSISYAAPEKISLLVNQNIITVNDAVKAFPDNEEIVNTAIHHPTNLVTSPQGTTHTSYSAFLKLAKLETIISLINKEKINDLEQILAAFPDNLDISAACYAKDANLIKKIPIAHIVDLVNAGKIPAADAIRLFPDNKEIVSTAIHRHKTSVVKSPGELIQLMKDGIVSPLEAVKNQPKNLAVVSEAYQLDPKVIKYADQETINALGRTNIVKAEDVLDAFSMVMPTTDELKNTETQFQAALNDERWEIVANICNKFWFEKPATADKKIISTELAEKAQWQRLYDFEQAAKAKDYQLTSGPFLKSPETYQLEHLARKMMKNEDFNVQLINGEDHFIFADATVFNWTKIRVNCDWQHVDLDHHDFETYKNFLAAENEQLGDRGSLLVSKENTYRAQLYRDQEMPDSPMSFAEMQAINLYTTPFYADMNGLMRGSENYHCQQVPKIYVRSALVHSVMAASGLRKVPTTTIKLSHRIASRGSKSEHQQRIEAAAKRDIIELSGFVSTTIVEGSYASGMSNIIAYEFTNLRGVNISAISRYPHENEYLIPPTQIQITGYKVARGRDTFEATIVSELGNKNKDNFDPQVVTNKADIELLKLAKPETIISLINQEENYDLEQILAAFPDNLDVIEACCAKDVNLIKKVPIAQVVELVNAGKIPASDATKAFPSMQENEERVSLQNKIDLKILKIQNAYQRQGQPNHYLITALFIDVCQINHSLGRTKFSSNTKEANYVIEQISKNEDFCKAFGIDPAQTEVQRVTAIKQLVQHVIEHQPLPASNSDWENVSGQELG